jgi:hypothetical protein
MNATTITMFVCIFMYISATFKHSFSIRLRQDSRLLYMQQLRKAHLPNEQLDLQVT